jgi:hypothetical protein
MPILSPGPTLCRAMTQDEIMGHIDGNRRSIVGGIVLPVSRSASPNIRNVDCALDRVSADDAVTACTIAATRLMRLNGLTTKESPPRNTPDLRREAERLIDMARAGDVMRYAAKMFHISRETCVIAAMEAIYNAASIVRPPKPEDDPVLPCDLQIGHTNFRRGTSMRIVQQVIEQYTTGGRQPALVGPEVGGALDDLEEPAQ